MEKNRTRKNGRESEKTPLRNEFNSILSEKYAVTAVQYRSRAIFIRRVIHEQSENNRS